MQLTDDALPAVPTWTHHADGSATIHLSPDALLNITEDLNTWKRLDNVNAAYGNCLDQIKARLGRREILAMMERVKVQEIDAKMTTTPPPPATTTDAGTGENLYTPFPAQINRKVVEVLGWVETDEWYHHPALGSMVRYWISPDGEKHKLPFPDFCSPDCPHSLMAQLLAKVYEVGFTAQKDFTQIIHDIYRGPESTGVLATVRKDMYLQTSLNFKVLNATPLQKTIACLRALSVYPATWGEPTE